ncbi:hypothetical protein ACIO3R_14570 [Streptomyces sp. NPDC087428]|uniref:hypothetical protein n=1 Tax=Streptomyces sp. NPDC087428 TaxID=3365788 RepID=UPI0037FDD0E1
MSLQFFGKDPNTDEDHCPTVWVDAAKAELLFQGWITDEDTQAKCLEYGSVPDTETIIRIPARMVPQIRKACDAAERAASAEATGAGTAELR